VQSHFEHPSQSFFSTTTFFLNIPTHLQLIHPNPLNNNPTRRAPTITYRRNPILANLQLMQQRHQNATPTAPQRMTQRNGATARIHILAAQTQDLGVGFDDGGKGFVKFPDGDVGF
jgi:hypothetical protein